MTKDALDPKDIATAGEYVLGTLPQSERQEFQRRLRDEPALRDEVARWQAHFDPLADEVRPVAPPVQVWPRIEDRLFGTNRRKRAASAPLWKWIAMGSSLATVGLAILLWTAAPQPPTPTGQPDRTLWLSDMVSEDGQVRLAALYDETSGEMRVSVGGAPPGEGRDFELWLIKDDQAPVSLGVMPRQGQAAMPIPDALRALVADATLAITDEPAGGSPEGVATGPVVASAALRRI